MEATARTIFNPAQIQILQMMSYCKTEDSLKTLKKVLCDFYAQQAQLEADRLWNEGTLGPEAIERLKDEHLRTPYSHAR